MVARLRTRPVGIRRGDFEGRRLKRGRSLKQRMALDDGRLELGNNLAERAIKPFVIGRKNFLFSDAPRGAEASAEIYSVVATGQGRRPEPAQVPGMAAGRDAQRRRPRQPGLPGLPDAVIGFRAGGDQAEAGRRGRGGQDG